MAGWKHSPVAERTKLESTYVPSTELANDAGSDPTTELDSEPTQNLEYADESIDESTTKSEPAEDSSLEPESRTDGCGNSC